MIYKILTLADIHFGAMDPIRLFKELNKVIEYLENNKIDLLVIAGDYWDSKQSLNNKISVCGIEFMNKLRELSLSNKFKIRIVLGTKAHDYDQLDVFDCFEDENFKIFRVNTSEETLPDLWAIYCPDENIINMEYMETYIDNITKDDGYNILYIKNEYYNELSWSDVFSDIDEYKRDEQAYQQCYHQNTRSVWRCR